ncbi:helix-turn-helix domain-containing protein [Streptomyces galilaeus]
MAGHKDLDPSTSPRALLGAELRHAREKAGLSQEELGQRLFVSGSFIGQLEAGTRRMVPEYARMLDRELGTGDFFERNCVAAAKSSYPEHFVEAAEAEARATAINQYATLLVPGLLQTNAYAEAVFRAYKPTATDAEIDVLVADRLKRTQILDHPTTPLLWFVLDEAVLRRGIGGSAVMAEALRHVLGLAQRRRIIVQALPFSAGAHAALDGPLKLMEFANEAPLSFVEAPDMGKLIDDPATVAHHAHMFKLLLAASLSAPDSLALIESVAQDYEHEEEHP